jgi:glutaredoxin
MRKWEMVMFTLRGCEYCKQLREGLDTLEIPYTNIDISTNDKLGDTLEETFKCTSYPMVLLKEPTQITWLPETELLTSTNIKVYNNIYGLIDEIFNTFNK